MEEIEIKIHEEDRIKYDAFLKTICFKPISPEKILELLKQANNMNDIQNKINEVYLKAFGRTPLRQRLDDVFGEAIELSRYIDLKNLREETSDLLGSVIQLANECGWSIEDLVNENIAKIQHRQQQYQSLGRKIKVAILGGAFDCITNGHVQVAKFVLDTSKTFDEVWLMPCYSHIFGKNLASSCAN